MQRQTRRYRSPFTLAVSILLALLLSACGPDATQPAAPSLTPTATLPPTATEVGQPTASPTTPPEASSGTEDDASPTPQTEAPGDTQAAGGACYTRYFPIRLDSTWRYRIEATATDPSEYTIRYEDITDDDFTVLQDFPMFSSQVRWICSGQGLIATDYANISLQNMEGFTFETIDFEGVTLPPSGQWQVGESWTSTYTLKASGGAMGQTIETEMTVATQNEIAAVEEVSVPAGTYPEAYRVTTTAQMTINLPGAGASVSQFAYNTWYVADVGMVRQNSVSDEAPYTIQLLSVTN